MRLISFAFVTCAAVLTTARSLVADGVLSTISKFVDKGTVLQQDLDALNSGTSISSALTLHGKFSSMMSDLRQVKTTLTPHLSGLGSVSSEECTEVLDAFYQAQPAFEGALKTIADKKPIIDGFPGFGRAPTLVALTLIDVKQLNDEVQDALFSVVPESCLSEARTLADQYNAAFDACLTVYQ